MIIDFFCRFCEKRMGSLRFFPSDVMKMDFCCEECENKCLPSAESHEDSVRMEDNIICDICGESEEFCLEHNHCFCDHDCCMDRVCPEARKEEC